MKCLIYGNHSSNLCDFLSKSSILSDWTFSGENPGNHIKYCGIIFLERFLQQHAPNVLLLSYVTNLQTNVLEFHEIFDKILYFCAEYNTIPVILITPHKLSDNLEYVENVKVYAENHNLLVINCNDLNLELSIKDPISSEVFKLIADLIAIKLAEYINLKKYLNINYDVPLAESVILDKLDLNVLVTKSIIISGKGHLHGFEIEMNDTIETEQWFLDKQRKVKYASSSKYITGAVLNPTFTLNTNKSFLVKSLFFKGSINSIVIDGNPYDLSTKLTPKANNSSQIELANVNDSFLCSELPTVHPCIVPQQTKLKEWATSVLNKVENCELQNTKLKNVIVIFSSQDRNYLTKQKKQYLTELSQSWNSDLQIIYDPLTVLTEEQLEIAKTFKSRRKNIISYVCKIVVVYNLLSTYDRVMWLDDTNVISPFAPNLFNVVPENKIGALVIPRNCGFGDAIHDYKYLIKHRNTTIRNRYYNTGVMVIPKTYRDIFSFESVIKDCDLFQSPYPTQCWQNYLMEIHNCEIFDISCMYNLMPCVYHYSPVYNEVLDISHLYEELLKYHIVHFTGFHKHREMLHQKFLEHCESIFDQKITIVIMNFKRSDNIKNYILPYYDNIHAINQVILVHCLKDTVFEYESDKVQHVYEWDTDKEYGVFTRYIAAKKYAKNQCILFTDDDVIIPAKTLSMVYQKWKQNPNRIIGAEGRRIYLNPLTNQYEYKSIRYHGDVDFLLTSCCMASYSNIVYTCSKESVMEEYKNTTVIKWNGEDMYLCLTCSVLYDTKCYSVDSPLISLDDGEHIISKVSSHVEERSRFLNLFFNYYKPISSFAPIIAELSIT